MRSLRPEDAPTPLRWPRISIVVPSYNQAGYLEEALASIVEQRYPELELIVMDGGSTDGSVEVIERYAPHLAYWQSQPDGGQSQALIDGFVRATGDVLGWLNSDDTLCPGGLDAIGRVFASDPDLRWVYGDGLLIDEASEVMITRPTVPLASDDLFNLHLYLPQECTYFRRAAYEQVGGLDASLHYAMDYDLWLRLARLAEPTHLRALIGSFRVVAGQKSGDVGAYVAEEEQVKARYADDFRSYTPLERARRLAAVRGGRLWRRARVDGPVSLLTHAVTVARGGQTSPGTRPETARRLLGGAGAAAVVAAAVAAWTRRRR